MNDINKTPADIYARPARILHWLMAAAFVFMWVCGYAMSEEWLEEESRAEELLYAAHMSVGVTLLALLAARIFVRRRFSPPPPMAGLSRFEVRASHAAHIALYVLPAVVIFAGWMQVDTGGHQVAFFGLHLPAVLPDIEYIGGFEFNEFLEETHETLAYMMLLLTLAHIGAVVKHRWIDGHDVLGRMAPRFLKK